MKGKTAAIAVMMCAVMVLVIGAPLVLADTHHVVKGAQGPRASAVSWDYVPVDNGAWVGHIVNSGLRWLVVNVDDVTGGAETSILHQRIRFAAYPTDTLDTRSAVMTAGRTYLITVIPNGPRGSFCDIDDAFIALKPPVAVFTSAIVDATVSVDASASYDPDGTVVAWGWEWGDTTTGSGQTAVHTYAETGDYTIVLTVMDNDGLTGSTSTVVHAIVPDNPPVASFTAVTLNLDVAVDASASTDDHGIISYSWNWGDGSPAGSGVTATHTYVEGTYTITLTVTDTALQTASTSQQVSPTAPVTPPVASFTATTASGGVLNVDGSASTSELGIVSYEWNFGDHIIASGVTRTHTYSTTGDYVVTLTVTDTLGQKASLQQTFSIVNSQLPPLPYTVFGYTTSGGSPVAGSSVDITNVRTGETLTDNVADASGLYYVSNIMPLYFVVGDTMVVTASSGALMGSSSVVLDFVGQPFLQVDVAMT